MVNIDKILKMKPKINAKTIVLGHYLDYLNVFGKKTNQLPSIRGFGINHQIELLEKKETNGFLGAVIQYIKKRTFNTEENIDRIFG